MIRRWFSNFIRNNKNKIKDLGTKLIMVAIVVLIATIMLSSFSNNTTSDNKNETYKPTETIIKGTNVSKEQYEKDTNTVNKFLDFCNNTQIESAYNLLSNECKETLYPTIEAFKSNYYNSIFGEKRGYNLQAWISTKNYTVYKIRYTTNMLATGEYKEDNIYEDYITLIKNATQEKVSIGELVYAEECNITTKTNEIEATVINKKVFIEYEEYTIKIKNNADTNILLDPLKTNKTIKLVAETGTEYTVNSNRVFLSDLTLEPGRTKELVLRFNKNCASNKESRKIQLSNVIINKDEYIKNKENYNDISTIYIELED